MVQPWKNKTPLATTAEREPPSKAKTQTIISRHSKLALYLCSGRRKDLLFLYSFNFILKMKVVFVLQASAIFRMLEI